MEVKVVRWLAAYRSCKADIVTSAHAEAIGIGRERAVEPLWRGRSILLTTRPHVTVGLGFKSDAVVRIFRRDIKSDPAGSSRLAPREVDSASLEIAARNPWRDWNRFARWWLRNEPTTYAEAWISAVAEPVAVCHRFGAAEDLANKLGKELGLPVLAIKTKERRYDF